MNIRLSAVLGFCLLMFAGRGAWALNVGDPAPDFAATTYDGHEIKLSELRGKVVVLEWFNPKCPFVLKHYRSGVMPARQKAAMAKGVVWLTVNSARPDSRDYIEGEAAAAVFKEMNLASAAFIHDGDGRLGRMFEAKSTPHMFIIAADGKLAYQGAIDDDSTIRGDPSKAHSYVTQALEELLSGKAVSTPETKPYGCSVKY